MSLCMRRGLDVFLFGVQRLEGGGATVAGPPCSPLRTAGDCSEETGEQIVPPWVGVSFTAVLLSLRWRCASCCCCCCRFACACAFRIVSSSPCVMTPGSSVSSTPMTAASSANTLPSPSMLSSSAAPSCFGCLCTSVSATCASSLVCRSATLCWPADEHEPVVVVAVAGFVAEDDDDDDDDCGGGDV